MASRTSESATHKGEKRDTQVVGRSAATGKFILKPASKPGAVSIKRANTAVKSVRSGTK